MRSERRITLTAVRPAGDGDVLAVGAVCLGELSDLAPFCALLGSLTA
jgi:hypothetical protein